MIPDKDDMPILALAVSKNIDIWSNDTHFKSQTLVKTYTTKELAETIGID